MYIAYKQIVSTAASVRVSGALLGWPSNATEVEIQADTQNIRYACDGSSPTSTSGMLFLTTEPPKLFLIEDFQQMRICSGAGGAGNLNLHFLSGRNI